MLATSRWIASSRDDRSPRAKSLRCLLFFARSDRRRLRNRRRPIPRANTPRTIHRETKKRCSSTRYDFPTGRWIWYSAIHVLRLCTIFLQRTMDLVSRSKKRASSVSYDSLLANDGLGIVQSGSKKRVSLLSDDFLLANDALVQSKPKSNKRCPVVSYNFLDARWIWYCAIEVEATVLCTIFLQRTTESVSRSKKRASLVSYDSLLANDHLGIV